MTLSPSPRRPSTLSFDFESQSRLIFREATLDDAKALNQLYNEAIRETTALEWDEERPLSEHQHYLKCMQAKEYPCLLAIEDDELVAYGALEQWTYDAEGDTSFFTARLSIVVQKMHRRHDIATGLWHALVEHPLTKKRKLYNIIAQILTCNTAAISFLKSLDFRYQGQLAEIAVKKGQRCGHAFFNRYIGSQPTFEDIAAFGFPQSQPIDLVKSVEVTASKITVRDATAADATFVLTTYNEVVLSSTALEYFEERTLQEKVQWLTDLIADGWLCMIAELDGVPIGYLSFEPYGEKGQCFRNTGVIAAFMQPIARRHGVGEVLFKHLLRHDVLRLQDIHYMIADLHTVNSAAVNAALKAGFAHQITLDNLNVKFGEWIACSWWRKVLPGNCKKSGRRSR